MRFQTFFTHWGTLVSCGQRPAGKKLEFWVKFCDIKNAETISQCSDTSLSAGGCCQLGGGSYQLGERSSSIRVSIERIWVKQQENGQFGTLNFLFKIL